MLPNATKCRMLSSKPTSLDSRLFRICPQGIRSNPRNSLTRSSRPTPQPNSSLQPAQHHDQSNNEMHFAQLPNFPDGGPPPCDHRSNAILVNCDGTAGFIGRKPSSLQEIKRGTDLNFTSKGWLTSRVLQLFQDRCDTGMDRRLQVLTFALALLVDTSEAPQLDQSDCTDRILSRYFCWED
jgi:hypothetical protein